MIQFDEHIFGGWVVQPPRRTGYFPPQKKTKDWNLQNCKSFKFGEKNMICRFNLSFPSLFFALDRINNGSTLQT